MATRALTLALSAFAFSLFRDSLSGTQGALSRRISRNLSKRGNKNGVEKRLRR